jgi:ABC-type phosphate transport system substrate-binding protein
VTRLLQKTAQLAAALAVLGLVAFPGIGASAAGASPAAPAGSYAAINGAGSSWSALLLDQWSQYMASADQLTVNFQPNGSAEGRQLYREGVLDFAASDPPFRNGTDKLDPNGKESELPVPYGYSYVPDTAGGTSFMYHLEVGGHLIRNMRLSPLTLMKIFTGQITNWDDPEIEHDYGAKLPSIPIIPVVRSDGSGATFFFTRYMAHMFPAQWNRFCAEVTGGRVKTNCGQTEFYPTYGPHWHPKAENGSTNVATFITSPYANGAIGYDEYAYALFSKYPVVQVLNPAGYYVGPTASNVAVALTKAKINEQVNSPNFLQQNLDSVYTFKDPRSYPLSSYSYLIVPRNNGKEPPQFSNAKGLSLSTFINYFLCAGQKDTAPLGYSPLPLNLVKGGLRQVLHIPGHGRTPNFRTMAGCNNPTFTNGVLTVLKDAPYPSKCQKVGAPLDCASGGGPSSSPSPGSSKSAGSGSSKGSSSGSNPGSGSGSSTGTSNPGTGSGTGSGTGAGTTTVNGQVVTVAASSADQPVLGAVTAAAILLAVTAPPALVFWLRRRRRQAPAGPEPPG